MKQKYASNNHEKFMTTLFLVNEHMKNIDIV
jgi:hypothetical protein